MIESTFKRLLAVMMLVEATALYGCASSYVEPTGDDAASGCEITAAAASAPECNSANRDDLARQARDEADYKDEPALGYLTSPPGLLPIPVNSRNTPN